LLAAQGQRRKQVFGQRTELELGARQRRRSGRIGQRARQARQAPELRRRLLLGASGALGGRNSVLGALGQVCQLAEVRSHGRGLLRGGGRGRRRLTCGGAQVGRRRRELGELRDVRRPGQEARALQREGCARGAVSRVLADEQQAPAAGRGQE